MQPVKPIFRNFIIFVFLLHGLLPLIRSIGNRVSHSGGHVGVPPPSYNFFNTPPPTNTDTSPMGHPPPPSEKQTPLN